MMPDLRYEQGWLLEKKYMTRGAKDQVDGTGWGRMGRNSRHAYFPTWNPFFFRETYFFSFCISPPPISSHCGKKRRRCGGGQKMSSPGGPSTTLSTSTRFVQALWRSFSVSSLYTTWYRVVSVVNSSICLSINNVHRFQMIFNCSCHR